MQTEDRVNRYNHEKAFKESLIPRDLYNDYSFNKNISRKISRESRNIFNEDTPGNRDYSDIKQNPNIPRNYPVNRPALPLPSNYKPKRPISDPLSPAINYLPMDLSNIQDRHYNEYLGLKSNVENPEKHLSNPKYLEDLRSSINSLKRDRYYRNPASRENNLKRLDKVRVDHDLGEKKEFGNDNPYGREALIKHQLQNIEGGLLNVKNVEEGRGDFGEVKAMRREYGNRFDNLMSKKLKYNNLNSDFNGLRYPGSVKKASRGNGMINEYDRAAGNFDRERSEQLDLFNKRNRRRGISEDHYQKKKNFRIVGGRVRRGEGGHFMNDSVEDVNSKSFNYHDLIKKKKKKILNFTQLPVVKKPADQMDSILSYDITGYKKIMKKKLKDRKHGNYRKELVMPKDNNAYKDIQKKNKGDKNLLKYSSFDNMFEDYSKKQQYEEKKRSFLYNLQRVKLSPDEIENMEGIAGLSSNKTERPDLRYYYKTPSKLDQIVNRKLVNGSFNMKKNKNYEELNAGDVGFEESTS